MAKFIVVFRECILFWDVFFEIIMTSQNMKSTTKSCWSQLENEGFKDSVSQSTPRFGVLSQSDAFYEYCILVFGSFAKASSFLRTQRAFPWDVVWDVVRPEVPRLEPVRLAMPKTTLLHMFLIRSFQVHAIHGKLFLITPFQFDEKGSIRRRRSKSFNAFPIRRKRFNSKKEKQVVYPSSGFFVKEARVWNR